ncbi:hypothetical protein VCRA212O16_860008 [Vibrio crassostreae]|nr:hypothetical protein VCRA212O16_860008 [Vibrio crassostreae]
MIIMNNNGSTSKVKSSITLIKSQHFYSLQHNAFYMTLRHILRPYNAAFHLSLQFVINKLVTTLRG